MKVAEPKLPAPGAWARKARALDQYRWLLLREHHGFLGSVIRFGRDALVDLVFGIRARLAMANHRVIAEPCDFLLLQGSPKVIPLQRKKRLIETLRARGYHLVETGQEEPRQVIAKRLVARPVQPVPLRYLGYAAYAEWLVQRHDPRVLINDRNGSLCSPFLRLSLNQRQRLFVHLAHATTVEGSRRLGMNDYDFYFLFGQSSLDALRARSLRFGQSTAVLVGSHMIDMSYQMPAPDVTKKTLLILGVGPDKEKEGEYQQTYELLASWVQKHPEYQVLIKPHPRSKVRFWQEVAGRSANVSVLDCDCSLADALARASLVINIVSNAVIEAALAGRPVLCVNLGGQSDVLQQEVFFGERIQTLTDLEQRVLDIERKSPEALAQANAFADFHLTNGIHGLESTIEALESLLRTAQLPDGLMRSVLAPVLSVRSEPIKRWEHRV
ncbi:capsule biosynthesis protein [Pseudomonas borbori]